jgi:aerobic carbon-monoxide dehydrogenase small subunit
MIKSFRTIALTVNGEDVCETVEPRTSLVDFLRERLGLTGSHVGCEQGVCGACTVRLDGVTVRGCLVLAVQCAGSKVETIEGVSDAGEIGDLQDAFVRRNALQCGFCTPGMLLAAQELLAQCGMPSRQQVRAHLSANYCRCTGYQAIVDAVEAVARTRLGARACRPQPQEPAGRNTPAAAPTLKRGLLPGSPSQMRDHGRR